MITRRTILQLLLLLSLTSCSIHRHSETATHQTQHWDLAFADSLATSLRIGTSERIHIKYVLPSSQFPAIYPAEQQAGDSYEATGVPSCPFLAAPGQLSTGSENTATSSIAPIIIEYEYTRTDTASYAGSQSVTFRDSCASTFQQDKRTSSKAISFPFSLSVVLPAVLFLLLLLLVTRRATR